MDRRSIVLKSIYCRGVQSFNLFQKPSTYASVSIASGNDDRRKPKQKQKTSADHEGNENPEWDQTIQFDFDDSDFQDLFLEFAIMAQGNLLLFGDKLIGKSRIPITDLSLGHPSDAFRHVSYQIRSPEGKPNGVLSFSYRLNLPEMEIRLPLSIDLEISSAASMDDYNPPQAQQTKSVYPPISLPEAESEDCFCYYNLPPPPPASGYYTAFDRAVSYPVLNLPVTANAGYYTSPAASIPPPMRAFGTYHPSAAPSYTYPPSDGFCSYCNCK